MYIKFKTIVNKEFNIMIKCRLTFVDNTKGQKELEETIDKLKENFDVINTSRIYKGRNGSMYSNIYLDIEKKEVK